ncbi:thiosulfate sulfurtransferase [Hapalosiphon sp. MRB220]|nr:thiosulfate sulfurtransferase [Hapalosiphon sp. MRB220]
MITYAHPEVLVDTQWVVDHLSDPNVRIIEAAMNPELYNSGHIPSAVFWNMITDLLLSDYRTNFDPTAWEKLLSRSGITNNTTVITYSDFPALEVSLFWLFKIFGHRDVRVLNGGRRKWVAEGRPLTTTLPTIVPTHYQIQASDPSSRIFWNEVRESIGKENSVLVDVRTPQEYSGEWFIIRPPQGKEQGGHISGAVHVCYDLTLNEDGTFKSFEDLQTLYSSKGITPDNNVITYCAVGARSAHTWFVLKYLLGYPNVQNYDGSWTEWSQLPNMPIESISA